MTLHTYPFERSWDMGDRGEVLPQGIKKANSVIELLCVGVNSRSIQVVVSHG